MIPTPVYIPRGPVYAAQHRLFLPNRLFRSAGAQALRPEENPVSPQEGSQFPLNDPLGLASRPAEQAFAGPSIRCIPLFPSPLSTVKPQSASVASTVKALDVNSRLRFVKRSKTLWRNLKLYSDDKSGGVDGCTTWHWSRSGHIPLPDARDQATAAYGLAGWYTAHINRGPAIVVNNEPSVQDEVQSQLLMALDLLIKSRYRNNSGKPLTHSQHVWRKRNNHPTNNPPAGVFMPKWSRATHAAHPAHGEAKRHAAGFPDYMITRSGNKLDNGASIEVKFFQTHPSDMFDDFFSSVVTDALNDYEFKWDEESGPTRVLKQIWGQVHFFGSKWGAVTNGRVICAYVRTGPNELTFSEVQDWEQDDVLQALTGLTFASIDDGFLANTFDLVEHLCPARDRDNDWVPTDASFEQQTRLARFRVESQVPQNDNPGQYFTIPVRHDPQHHAAQGPPFVQTYQAGQTHPVQPQAHTQVNSTAFSQWPAAGWPAGHQSSQHASGSVPGPSNLSRRQGEPRGPRR